MKRKVRGAAVAAMVITAIVLLYTVVTTDGQAQSFHRQLVTAGFDEVEVRKDPDGPARYQGAARLGECDLEFIQIKQSRLNQFGHDRDHYRLWKVQGNLVPNALPDKEKPRVADVYRYLTSHPTGFGCDPRRHN